jgi:hypothetical protein
MATTPNRLQVGTTFDQAIPLLNDNFDKAVQDIRDLGASTATSIWVPIGPVASGAVAAQTVTLASSSKPTGSPFELLTQKSAGAVAVAQYFALIYIDSQAADHLWLVGSALTAEQSNFQCMINASNTTFNGSLAAWTIEILNRGASAHTYYVQIGAWYVPVTAPGLFR